MVIDEHEHTWYRIPSLLEVPARDVRPLLETEGWAGLAITGRLVECWNGCGGVGVWIKPEDEEA